MGFWFFRTPQTNAD